MELREKMFYISYRSKAERDDSLMFSKSWFYAAGPERKRPFSEFRSKSRLDITRRICRARKRSGCDGVYLQTGQPSV